MNSAGEPPPLPPLPSKAPSPPAAPQNLYQCRVCGTLTIPVRLCPKCNTPVGTIANPNDPTCNSFLHIGYPYPDNESHIRGERSEQDATP